MRLAQLEGRRVAIWGCGREGRAALNVLRTRLPALPLCVFCNAQEAAALPFAAQLDIRTAAPDANALAAFDVVVKSPGISSYRPEIAAAQASGTVFTSGTALWFAERPEARVIGVTGTKGKSTVSALIACLARKLGVRTALAGNIGLPLLELLDAKAELWVVELSSFQTGEAGPVELGVITSLYEEHLDWHGSRERYVADKLQLADASRMLLVNATQPRLLERTAAHPHRLLFGHADGWHVGEDHCIDKGRVCMADCTDLPLLGGHNRLNACAALAALDALGLLARDSDMAASLASFAPLPHRLQPLGERDGLRWFNDSISTTPQATLAALESLGPGGISVIVGGHDRGLDWSGFVDAVVGLPRLRIVTQGANGPRIAAALHAAGVASLHQAQDLQAAVAIARRISQRGDTILLSPGAPSFDQFRDYAERGQCFAQLAGFSAQTAEIGGLGVA